MLIRILLVSEERLTFIYMPRTFTAVPSAKMLLKTYYKRYTQVPLTQSDQGPICLASARATDDTKTIYYGILFIMGVEKVSGPFSKMKLSIITSYIFTFAPQHLP